MLKELNPLAECLARIHFSRQNKRLQLETAGIATSQALLLTLLPIPPPGRAFCPATGFCSLSPFPVCPAAPVSQNTRWEEISLRSLAMKAPARKGWVGRGGSCRCSSLGLSPPCVLCSRVTLTGSGVLHVPAAFPALQRIYLKCGSWLSRRIESALSQTNPSLFYSFSAVCIILKQREEALNELFLQWNHTQSF